MSDTPISMQDLHRRIINLPTKPYDGSTTYDAYCRGHKEARHAAAELVASMAQGGQMTDDWLMAAFQRAISLGSCALDEPAANVLRGFANRVLQQFGDRAGMRDALNVPYTRVQRGGAPGATDAERAAWLADKIGALGDYAREAADMLRRWPGAPTPAKVDLLGDGVMRPSGMGQPQPAARQSSNQRDEKE